jgi:hypothetical protein
VLCKQCDNVWTKATFILEKTNNKLAAGISCGACLNKFTVYLARDGGPRYDYGNDDCPARTQNSGGGSVCNSTQGVSGRG